MNYNLEALMYESGLTADGCWDQMDTYDKEAIMKFAELIIDRCLSELMCMHVNVHTHHNFYKHAAVMLKQSFKDLE